MTQLPVDVKVIRSVEDLEAFSGTAAIGDQLYLRGYYPSSARGGGFLVLTDSLSASADKFLEFVDGFPGANGTHRLWKRVLGSGPVDAYMAGAEGAGRVIDGEAMGPDEGAALKKLFDYFKSTIAGGGAGAVKSILQIGGGQFCSNLSQDLTSKEVDGKSLHEAGVWSIDGTGATILGRCGGKPVLDMTDSRFGTVMNLQIYGSSAEGEVPSCGIRIGRIEDNRAANQMQLHRVRTDGEFLIAGVHNIASEQLYTLGCEFGNERESQDAYGYCADGINFVDWARPKVISSSSGSPIIPGISQSDPAVVRSPGHGYSIGSKVMLTGVKNMTFGIEEFDINNKVFEVDAVTTDTFEIVGVDTSLSAPYSSGGRVFKQLHGSDFVQTTLSPWTQHSFKAQTHIALRAQCARGRAAILETGDSRHLYQAHTSCGFYTPDGVVARNISAITDTSPATFTATPAYAFPAGSYVYVVGAVEPYNVLNDRIFIVNNVNTSVSSGVTNFQLTDLDGIPINGAGTYTSGATATRQVTNGGVGMRMVIDGTLKQCDYKLHHEPGGRANAVLAWATIESLEGVRDGGAHPVELDGTVFSEIAVQSQDAFITADTETVSGVIMHAGGVNISHFRDRFGGQSIANKLLTPPGLWSLIGADLVIDEPAADPFAFAAFSGRYSIANPPIYFERNSPELWGLRSQHTVDWLAKVMAAGAAAPSRARALLYDELIVFLIAAGVWERPDNIYLFAAHDRIAAGIGLIDPTLPAIKEVGAAGLTFTIDKGFTGNGTSAWLDTGMAANAAGRRFTQASACMGVASGSEAQGAYRDAGLTGLSTALISPWDANNKFSTRGNCTATANTTMTSSKGFFAWSRLADVAGSYKRYYGAGVTATPAETTATISGSTAPSGNFAFLQGGGVNFSTRQLAAGFVGAGLTTAQMNALYTALKTYLTAVGAWV